MNDLQVVKQFQYMLKNRTWNESGGLAVFGQDGVVVSDDDIAQVQANHRFPACVLRIGPAEMDPQHPGKLSQIIEATALVQLAGDASGQNALLGANRGSSGAASSEGRGLLEVQEELLAVARQMQETVGIKMVCRSRSAAAPAMIESAMFAMREYSFEVQCTDRRYYHPPLRFTGADAGFGFINFSWTAPPTRFDSRARTMVRRAPGATPPATPSDGTEVFLGSGTSGLSIQAPGTYSFAAFAIYTDTGAAVDERYSAQEDGTTKTIVGT